MGRRQKVTRWGVRALWVAMPLLLVIGCVKAPRCRPYGLACGIAALGLMHHGDTLEADSVADGLRRLID